MPQVDVRNFDPTLNSSWSHHGVEYGARLRLQGTLDLRRRRPLHACESKDPDGRPAPHNTQKNDRREAREIGSSASYVAYHEAPSRENKTEQRHTESWATKYVCTRSTYLSALASLNVLTALPSLSPANKKTHLYYRSAAEAVSGAGVDKKLKRTTFR